MIPKMIRNKKIIKSIKTNINKENIITILEDNRDELKIDWFISNGQDFEDFLQEYENTETYTILKNKYENSNVYLLEIMQGNYLTRIKPFNNSQEIVDFIKTYY